MQGAQGFDKRSCLVAMSIGATLGNAAGAGFSAADFSA
jgi:hypothetical protein